MNFPPMSQAQAKALWECLVATKGEGDYLNAAARHGLRIAGCGDEDISDWKYKPERIAAFLRHWVDALEGEK